MRARGALISWGDGLIGHDAARRGHRSPAGRPFPATASGVDLLTILRLLRARQWLKNGVVGAAIVFAGRLDQFSSVRLTLLAFVIFCAISSGGYVLNDVVDAAADRQHPVKRFRPIAAGQVNSGSALVTAAALFGIALLAAFTVRPSFVVVTGAYGLLTVAYSLGLKRLAVLDLLAVVAGFLLRALAGAVAINVPVSGWLLLLTGLLALYIIMAKRLTDPAPSTLRGIRPIYPALWLKRSIVATAAATIAAYAGYCLLAHNLPADHVMLISAPFVAAGLFRYARLAGAVGARPGPWITAAPEETLLRDTPLLLCVAGWVAVCVAALYWIR